MLRLSSIDGASHINQRRSFPNAPSSIIDSFLGKCHCLGSTGRKLRIGHQGGRPRGDLHRQDKSHSSLPVADMQTLCNDFNTYLVRQAAQDFAQRWCVQAAFLATSMGTATNPSQACHDSYTSCMGSSSKNSAGITIEGLCPANSSVTTCSLTVSTYIQCLDEIIDAAKAAWDLKDNLCENLAQCTGLCTSPLTLPSTCVLVRDTCQAVVPIVDYTTTG